MSATLDIRMDWCEDPDHEFPPRPAPCVVVNGTPICSECLEAWISPVSDLHALEIEAANRERMRELAQRRRPALDDERARCLAKAAVLRMEAERE